jgi:NADPH2 dehydrogenase
MENRSRFAHETVRVVSDAIGPKCVGHRMSPFGKLWGMGMRDPIPQFAKVINRLWEIRIDHIHLIEPRISGGI